MDEVNSDEPESLMTFGGGNLKDGDFVRIVVETFQHPFIMLTWDLRVLAANRTFYRTFNVSPKETTGRFIYELGNGQWDIPALRTLLEKILPTETAFSNYEVVHDFPIIGRKIMKVSARRFLQGEGMEPMVLMALEDITELKNMENELRLSESKYRSLFETTRDGILILDYETRRIDSVNPFLTELLGYPKEELWDKEVDAAGIFKDAEAVRTLFEQLQAKGRMRCDHMPLKSKEGRFIDVEIVCNVFQSGDRHWAQCNFRDISERKRVDEALKFGAEKLRQSQKAEAIGKLAAGVAHEFNNLLTAINGYCVLSLNLVEPQGALHDNLEEIKKAGDRAAMLTHQILAYSRQQILVPQRLHIGTLVEGMLNQLRKRLREGVELAFIPDPSLDLVKADQGQLEQVITNLVLNASDSIPKEGKITLETRRVELDENYASLHPLVFPGIYAMLSVSDTGAGMDAATRAHVFDPFYSSKGPGKRGGLGLSMVYGIIKQSDGHISAYSEKGFGSVFKVYLPAINAQGERISTPIQEAIAPGKETVLVVEDEKAVRSFIREALIANGYTVLEAGDGSVALSLIEGHPGQIDLLLTDLFLPGMGGHELSQRFLFRHQEGRVLFMSGYTYDAIFQHGLLEENFHFIQKPFTPSSLVKSVRATLDLELNKTY